MSLGRTHADLPFGVQLITRRRDNDRLLAIARSIVQLTGGCEPPPGFDGA